MAGQSSTLFYKARIKIKATEPDTDLLWELVLHIRRWQLGKWNRRNPKTGGREIILPPSKRDWSMLKFGKNLNSVNVPPPTIYISSELFTDPEDKNNISWACVIQEQPYSPRGVAPRSWETEIGFEQTKPDVAIVSISLSYRDFAGFIGPYQDEPTQSVPKIIRNICSDKRLKCSMGYDSLEEDATRLYPDDWLIFYNSMKSLDREIPYLFMSPTFVENGTSRPTPEYPIDPSVIQKALLGNAKVFYTTSPYMLSEMANTTPDYVCPSGSITIFNINGKSTTKPRFFTKEEVAEYGEENILKFLGRAFNQTMGPRDRLFGMEDVREKITDAARRERLRSIRAAHEAELSVLADNLSQVEDEAARRELEATKREEQSLDLAAEEEEKRLIAEEITAHTKREMDAMKEENWMLERRVESLEAAAVENMALRKSLDARTHIKQCPNSPDTVVAYFCEMYADRMAFSQEAIRSLDGCVIRPETLWQVLYALANSAWAQFKSGSGDIYAAIRHETGIDFSRGEGRLTRKDNVLMRQFWTSYEGEKIDIEPHLTFPKIRQSIHFGWSEKHQKIIVGHCGEHLDNYSTRKVH